jgi:hypothetical protein
VRLDDEGVAPADRLVEPDVELTVREGAGVGGDEFDVEFVCDLRREFRVGPT